MIFYKTQLALALLTVSLLLCSCGSTAESSAPVSSPEPEEQEIITPAVVAVDNVEIPSNATELSYSGDIHALVSAAKNLPELNDITLEDISTAQDIIELRTAYPAAALHYSISFNGQTLDESSKTLDLSGLGSDSTAELVECISVLPALDKLSLEETELTLDDYVSLYAARPDIDYSFCFELYGLELTDETEELRFRKKKFGDEGLECFYSYLPCLPKLSYLSIDRCNTTTAATVALRDAFPDKKIVFRVRFGEYSCLTDETRIWAIGTLNDAAMDEIQYCTDVKYLDLGHNSITRIDFVKNMPDLEVLIIAIGDVYDISPLQYCPKLEYLELTASKVTDISVLSNCTQLKHLEISQLYELEDISAIMDLDLERMQALSCPKIPEEQQEEFLSRHPDCNARFGWTRSPYMQFGWRYDGSVGKAGMSERYALLREQIGYDNEFGLTKLYEWMEKD